MKARKERGGICMQKVLLAIGNRQIEEFLQKKLEDDFYFVGTSTYREGILNNIQKNVPDIIILREGLKGNQNISEIIYEIRRHYQGTRIIFITGNREAGDELLAMLVNLQIFDILANERINVNEIVKLVRVPNSYQQVAHFQPKMIVDDRTKKLLFESPDASNVVQTVEKVVFVERPQKIPAIPVAPVSPTEAEKERKSRLGRGFFGKKEMGEAPEGNEVEESTTLPVESPSPEKRKPMFGRKRQSLDGLEEPGEKVDTKALEREEKARLQAEKKQMAQEQERLRQEEKELQRAQAEAQKQAQKQAEAIRLQEQERINQQALREEEERHKQDEFYLKTLELQKQIEEMSKNKEADRFLSQELPPHSKQKIITFIGGEHGVGNTQVALNTAIQLSQNGYKTIYIELKEKPSTVDYLYQLHRNVDNGLEVALFNLETQDYRGVHKSITRMKDVIERTREGDLMLDYYKTFPKNLDFLFFSPSYTESGNELMAGNPQGLKELCMHLLFESGYHFIILDADIEKSNPYTEVALRFGTQVFYTLTQDVCHIGNSVRHVADLSKSINIKDKLYYVVNKYEDADIHRNSIADWLKTDVHLFVPNANREFINANYTGQPVLLSTKQKDIKKAFMEIAQKIQNM